MLVRQQLLGIHERPTHKHVPSRPGLQGNPPLAALPPELGQLPRLKHLSAADCSLERVPPELGHLPQLQSLSLYGNQLAEVPPGILQVSRG